MLTLPLRLIFALAMRKSALSSGIFLRTSVSSGIVVTFYYRIGVSEAIRRQTCWLDGGVPTISGMFTRWNLPLDFGMLRCIGLSPLAEGKEHSRLALSALAAMRMLKIRTPLFCPCLDLVGETSSRSGVGASFIAV